MFDGFIKTAAASPAIRVGDCKNNAAQIIACMKQAREAGAHLLVLPELCITGYTCGDLFLQKTLLDGATEALDHITESSKGMQLVTVVGLPVVKDGNLYNCAAVLFEGKILGFVPKKNLPNYSEFYEKRYFTPCPQENGRIHLGGRDYPFGNRLLFACHDLPAWTIGVEICEDLWVPKAPSVEHALAGATVIANLSASDETVGKAAFRRSLVCSQSARLFCGYVYADAGEGESTSDLVFSGQCMIAENGVLLDEKQPFQGGLSISEIDVEHLCAERRRVNTFEGGQTDGYERICFDLPLTQTQLTRPVPAYPFIPQQETDRDLRCEEILAMQTAGLRKRLAHTGSKTAVVGISGGLDSCLALLVAVRAMDQLERPRTDVVAVTMPCFGTTSRTKNNAEQLCEMLGVTLRCVDITQAVRQHFSDIGHDENCYDVTFENAQARERTQVLMDIANAQGGMVIGTGDLSELALGWATYNGDHMSMYGVNASVPKTLVRYLVRYCAEHAEEELRAVLMDILDTPVSPELLPAQEGEISQRTEDLVGPYDLHDFILYHAIRWSESPKKVFRLAKLAFCDQYDAKTIHHWLEQFYRRFFSQQFKRSCMPDGPKVGSVALSPRGDWRMPSDACAALWLEQVEQFGTQA